MKFAEEDKLGSEIARARWAHRRPEVIQFQQRPEILLRRTSGEIHHSIQQISEPNVESSHDQWWSDWQSFADHFLLRRMLDNGFLPKTFDYNGTDNPRSHIQSQQIAATRGYRLLPNSGDRKIGYGEKEAWAAAITLLDGSGYFWETGFSQTWRTLAINVSSQFVVPNSLKDQPYPYVLDQLWIVRSTDQSIRLIALEIDESVHRDEKTRIKDAARDIFLASLGYEVFRVAAWWCEIDPYRVMATFLSASGLVPDADKNFIGRELKTISQYICAKCGEPMVRWDEDWIQRVYDWSKQPVLVHKKCANDIEVFGW